MSDDKGGTIIVVKKVVKGGGHHGGAWKVAYADFVTAMMAFFLLLWLLGALDEKSKAALAKHFSTYNMFQGKSTPLPLQGETSGMTGEQKGESSGAADTVNTTELQENLAKMVEDSLEQYKDQIIVQLENGNVRIEIIENDSSSFFQSGSAQMKTNMNNILKKITSVIKDLPSRVVIEGHTDASGYTGSSYTNWELSTERASSARQVVCANGLNEKRIAMVAGYASTMPYAKNDPLSSVNRRISLLLLTSKTEPVIN